MTDRTDDRRRDGDRPARGHAVYGISVASELTDIPVQTLRLWERQGLLTPHRSGGGTRRFSADDITRIRRIAALVSDGVNLTGVTRILELQDDNNTLQHSNDKLQKSNTTLEGENNDLQSDNSILRGDNTTLRGQNTNLRGDNDTLRDDNNTLHGDNKTLRTVAGPKPHSEERHSTHAQRARGDETRN